MRRSRKDPSGYHQGLDHSTIWDRAWVARGPAPSLGFSPLPFWAEAPPRFPVLGNHLGPFFGTLATSAVQSGKIPRIPGPGAQGGALHHVAKATSGASFAPGSRQTNPPPHLPPLHLLLPPQSNTSELRGSQLTSVQFPPQSNTSELRGSQLTSVHNTSELQVSQRTSVQFSHSVVSIFLRPCGLQDAGLPCPSPTPGAGSDSCPLSR